MSDSNKAQGTYFCSIGNQIELYEWPPKSGGYIELRPKQADQEPIIVLTRAEARILARALEEVAQLLETTS